MNRPLEPSRGSNASTCFHPPGTSRACVHARAQGLAAAGLGLVDETNVVHELLPVQQGGMGASLVQVASSAQLWAGSVTPPQVGWIVASAMLSGACALWCQGKGQAKVSAPRAQLFFSTSPLFGALWALLLLREPITQHEAVGGAMLLGGLAYASQATGDEDEKEGEATA